VLYTSREERKELEEMLKKRNITAKKLFVASKSDICNYRDSMKISARTGEGLQELKTQIWESLCLIRTYTKRNNKVEKIPVVLKKGSSLKEFAKEIHKDFIENFAFARVYDKTQFSGRKVGLKYELKEGDIVEIHTK